MNNGTAILIAAQDGHSDPAWHGILAIVVTVLGFGTLHVPIRSFPAGDGFFVQWAMSVGAICVGFLINIYTEFPPFEPVAMLGGAFWCIANCISQRVISGLGLAVGLLLWSSTNCLTGWSVGKFGLFGVKAKPAENEIINVLGLAAVLFGSLMISFVRKVPSTDAYRVQPLNDLETTTECGSLHKKSISMPDLVQIEKQARKELNFFTRHTERIICISLALIAGFFYCLTLIPIWRMEENAQLYPNSSRTGLPYMFSHFFGVFLTSSAIFIVYALFRLNKPCVNEQIVLPSILGGTIWAISMSGLVIANDILGQVIVYPMTTTIPGVVASLWSIFYFKEINSRRNYTILLISFTVIAVGALLVSFSKLKL
ncbi:hypothetical protein M3Y95_00127300 [Aphelenchoides besseyi]|nr:hypothetical protein M3Y95_00127300 [Aphelenchoides besseyi]